MSHNKLVALLQGGFDAETVPSPASPFPKLTEMIHVLDADASQARIIEAVRAGHDLVIQGPPGTGKSQTIANIIASAIYDGKTVLFVAEKMAALSVVYKRLEECGLVDACLELYSQKTTKKAFWDSIKKVYAENETVAYHDTTSSTLQETADRLDAIAHLLHTPIGDQDYTPFHVWQQLSLNTYVTRFMKMATEMSRYTEWVELYTLREKLHIAQNVCMHLENGTLQGHQAVDAFERLVAEARWEKCRQVRPEIIEIFKENRHELVENFSKLEHQERSRTIQRIKNRYRERLPRGSMGEMEFVRSEMQKNRRLSSIRTAIEKAANMILRISRYS